MIDLHQVFEDAQHHHFVRLGLMLDQDVQGQVGPLPSAAQRDRDDQVRREMAVVGGDVGGALDLHPREVEAVEVRHAGQRQQVADVAGAFEQDLQPVLLELADDFHDAHTGHEPPPSRRHA